MLQCEMTFTAVRTRSPKCDWTYADYCRIPADGKRHEVIDGRHYVTPAPEPYHQTLVLGLASELRARIDKTGRGQVHIAPIDVHLAKGTVVQPDILAVAQERRAIVGKKKITGAPTLIVEVLSPSLSAHRRDRKVKLARYQRAGVAEYLIVDPVTRSIEQFVLAGHQYQAPRRCTDRLALATFPGVVIDLREVW